jgi:hypothetical protein
MGAKGVGGGDEMEEGGGVGMEERGRVGMEEGGRVGMEEGGVHGCLVGWRLEEEELLSYSVKSASAHTRTHALTKPRLAGLLADHLTSSATSVAWFGQVRCAR